MDVLLKSAMERLKGKERMVMGLHYEQHMPFVDIAKLLGLTKGRISQIHHAAIARMRREIRGDDAISA
jgi:RNA polymerase sigma factor for flagellar operon FliA